MKSKLDKDEKTKSNLKNEQTEMNAQSKSELHENLEKKEHNHEKEVNQSQNQTQKHAEKREKASESDCECATEGEECSCCEDKKEYLDDLQRLQAEFDNYRKRMQSALSDARQDGFMDAITNFLPALDSFKMATDMIQDKNTLMGIKFIENGILDTLSKMGVEEIDCSGKFDPKFHQAIDTDSSAPVETDMIVSVAYKGFIYHGKVIRYAQVVVKK